MSKRPFQRSRIHSRSAQPSELRVSERSALAENTGDAARRPPVLEMRHARAIRVRATVSISHSGCVNASIASCKVGRRGDE